MATLAAIGALAAAGAGAYATSASANAARANNRLAAEQNALQRRMAERQMELATASTRNARGDVVRYVPGFGWVEELSPMSQAIDSASQSEELQRIVGDAARSRMTRERNFNRRLTETGLADALLARATLGARTPEQVQAAAVRTGIADAAAAPNAARSSIVTAALRQGTGGEAALARLGTQTMNDRRSVIARAGAETPRMFAGEENARMEGPLQRYNMLASRAAQSDDLPFNPSSLADALSASRSRQQSVAPQGIGAAMNMRFSPMSPVDDRIGVRIGSAAAGLEGFFENKNVRNLFNGLFNRQQSGVPQQSRAPDVNEGMF